MNYKIIVICAALIVCCCGCSKNGINGVNKVSSEELIEQFFLISEVEYSIIEELYELKDENYGGFYRVVIKVNQENVSDFIEKVEENYHIPEDIEWYSAPIMNVYGKELGEKDVFYTRASGVRRTIEGVSIPKTCEFYIICSEKTNGDYEVLMDYSE